VRVPRVPLRRRPEGPLPLGEMAKRRGVEPVPRGEPLRPDEGPVLVSLGPSGPPRQDVPLERGEIDEADAQDDGEDREREPPPEPLVQYGISSSSRPK
jgi:hypothetical protein